MVLAFWGFWLSQRVCLTTISYYCCSNDFLRVLANKEYANDAKFRKFRRQLFHSSLAKMLESLKPGMTTPEIVRCPDGHFRRAIYGIGPYIADYPEQALLSSIVQGWCPRFVFNI